LEKLGEDAHVFEYYIELKVNKTGHLNEKLSAAFTSIYEGNFMKLQEAVTMIVLHTYNSRGCTCMEILYPYLNVNSDIPPAL